MKVARIFELIILIFLSINIIYCQNTLKKIFSLFSLHIFIGIALLSEKQEYFCFLILTLLGGGTTVLTFIWATGETKLFLKKEKSSLNFFREQIIMPVLVTALILNKDNPPFNSHINRHSKVDLELLYKTIFNEDNASGLIILAAISLSLLCAISISKFNNVKDTRKLDRL